MSLAIELKNIKKEYQVGDNVYRALRGVDIRIDKGELISLMGSSGAGKSTLMNIIGLLDNPTSGEYLLDNRNVSTLSDDERSLIRNLKIGFVFQSFFLLSRLTAQQNVELPLIYRGIQPAERRDRSLAVLDKVGMSEFVQRRPNELSGGQQQRVAIARALIGKPTVVLADEPTGALDSKTGQDVMDLFTQLNSDEGVTIIIVTHDPGVGDRCQRIVHIKDGFVDGGEGGSSVNELREE